MSINDWFFDDFFRDFRQFFVKFFWLKIILRFLGNWKLINCCSKMINFLQMKSIKNTPKIRDLLCFPSIELFAWSWVLILRSGNFLFGWLNSPLNVELFLERISLVKIIWRILGNFDEIIKFFREFWGEWWFLQEIAMFGISLEFIWGVGIYE